MNTIKPLGKMLHMVLLSQPLHGNKIAIKKRGSTLEGRIRERTPQRKLSSPLIASDNPDPPKGNSATMTRQRA